MRNNPTFTGKTSVEYVMQVSGATECQLWTWRTRGYLHPEGDGGTGRAFDWPPEEVRVAIEMKRLIDAGVTPAAAARAARNGGELAPGVRVVVDTEVSA